MLLTALLTTAIVATNPPVPDASTLRTPITASINRAVIAVSGTPRETMQVESDWNRVRGLAHGTWIVMTMTNGEHIRAKLLSVNDTEVVVERSFQAVDQLPRERIAQVRLQPDGVGRSVGIGAAVGAAAGFLIGHAKERHGGDDSGLLTFVGLTFGGGFGALIGAAEGWARPGELVYRKP